MHSAECVTMSLENLVGYEDSDSDDDPSQRISPLRNGLPALARVKEENESSVCTVVWQDFSPNSYQASSSNSSWSSIKDRFVDMGYSSTIVEKAIQIHGTENEDDILDYVLACQATEHSSDSSGGESYTDPNMLEYEDTNNLVLNQVNQCDHHAANQGHVLEEIRPDDCRAHNIRAHLLEMGYSENEVSSVIEINGVDTPVDELVDFIDAHLRGIERNEDVEEPYMQNCWKEKGLELQDEEACPSRFHKRKQVDIKLNHLKSNSSSMHKKASFLHNNTILKKKKCIDRVQSKRASSSFEHMILPDPSLKRLIGYGVPGYPIGRRPKELKEFIHGPPFFYFENVAMTPKDVWKTISRHFNGVEPEFVDSKYFSASSRPRGYVHNLPIEGRFQLLPLPPMTIQEAFPQTQKYWPSWDHRSKLNCINTGRVSDVLCKELRSIIKNSQGKPSLSEQVYILENCKKWNLVWVGPDQMAPLEPHEIELLLGYEKDHTRGASSRTDRLQCLGNAFQIDTVGYHLSSLKPFYPDGMKVLSLFSGIGGAEVALNRVGISLKCVVSVEICAKNRLILGSWWKKTRQTGRLIEKEDVQHLTDEVLEELIEEVGGFDLIIGGSPCNNLSGNNRNSRDGLEGRQSSVFYEFPRILNVVRQKMRLKGMA
eukprot:Gb_33731 [translate_table: standard]